MALKEEFIQQGNWLFKRRSYLPLIPLLIAFALYLRNHIYPEYSPFRNSRQELYFEMLAVLIGLSGLLVRIITVGYTPKNTSGRNTNEGQVADSLNTTGIYSLVRHPLYVGNFLMWLGIALWTANFWFIIAFILFYWLYYERIMFAEEQFLHKKFGNQYLDWSKTTPAFLPNFKGYLAPNLPFNWNKIFRQEKNGLFALFLIFCCFNIAGELLAPGEPDFNYFLIIMTLLSGLAYLVLKFLKKKTDVLKD